MNYSEKMDLRNCTEAFRTPQLFGPSREPTALAKQALHNELDRLKRKRTESRINKQAVTFRDRGKSAETTMENY